jgi:hypothetical protein
MFGVFILAPSKTVDTTQKLNETEPLPYTLGQAAKATGKQKSTILDAIKGGRLSATRDDKNQWQIDPVELFRVYPPNTETEREETPHNDSKTELLEEKIRHLEREIRHLEQTTGDLREDRDHWRRQATHLLTHQPKTEPSATPSIESAAPASKGGLFEKLFGRGKAGG